MQVNFLHKLSRPLLALLAMVAFSLIAFAQREAGSVQGTVTDPSGAVVSGAKVTVKSAGTGAVRETTTNAQGSYTVSTLQPGPYNLTITAAGFAPQTLRVDVTVGSINTVDVKMTLGKEVSTVEVVGAGGVEVETQTQELSSVVSGTQITTLPTLTRNPYDLVLTVPNVQTAQGPDNTAAAARGAGVTINGQRSASTDILLDGGENVDTFTAVVGQGVPLDSVQEFRVITSDFSAEYGRASGGVVNLSTKSGTNDFHGSVYEFNRLSAYTSNTYANAVTPSTDKNGNPIPFTEKPGYTRNQFGWAVGGPIVKNKLFFFNSVEFIRVRSAATLLAFVPSAQFLAAAAPNTQAFFNTLGTPPAGVGETFAQLGIAPGGPLSTAFAATGQPVMDLVSKSVPQDSGGGTPENQYQIVGRVDYNLSDKTTLYGRYAYQHIDQFPGSISANVYSGYNTPELDRNNNILLSVTHVFTPNLVNQAKVAFNRLNDLQPLGPAGDVPTLYMNDTVGVTLQGHFVMFPGYLPTTPGNGIPFGGPQNLAQLFDDVSWSRGKHQFKFGGQYVYTRDNRVFGAYETAVEGLTQGSTDNSTALERFLSGGLGIFEAAVFPQNEFPCVRAFGTGSTQVTPACTLTLPLTQPNFSRSNRYNDLAFYGQDSWRVTPRLTLNLGARWEYYGVQHSKHATQDSNLVFGSTGCPSYAPNCPGYAFPDQVANSLVFTEPTSPLHSLWEPQYHNFAPRIGFAWDVFGDGKTSVRGGFGIAYERNFGNVTFNIIQNPPNYAVTQFITCATGTSTAGCTPIDPNNLGPNAGASGTKPFSQPSLRAVAGNIPTAYAEQWSLSLEREVLKNTVLQVQYTGSRGIHLYDIAGFNRGMAGCVYIGDPVCANTQIASRGRPNLGYSSINQRGAHGDSYYDALIVALRTSNFRNLGMSFNANYTYSHSIDDLSTTFSEGFNTFNLGYMDPYQPGLDKGNGDTDARNRFVFSGIWDLPVGRSSSGILKQVIGGWTLAPIFTARTGLPFTEWDCGFTVFACVRSTFNTTPNFSTISDPVNLQATGGAPNTFNLGNLPGGTAYQGFAALNALMGQPIGDFGQCNAVPTTVFPCPYPGTMTRRNSFVGPSNWFLNLGIYKNFKLTERFNLQFRTEFYNIFNHHNFYVNGAGAQADCITQGTGTNPSLGGTLGPCWNGPDATATPAPTVLPNFVPGVKGGFGTNTDERRFIQFALKLTF